MYNACVISSYRSRSTFFLDSVCQYRQCNNYFEAYDLELIKKWSLKELIKLKNSTEEQNLKIRKVLIQDRILKITNEVFSPNENYGLKFLPRSLVPSLYNQKESYYFDYEKACVDADPNRFFLNLQDYNPYIITNITELFRLNEYNDVYILNRNITDCVCSFVYAFYIKSFLFRKKEDINRLNDLRIEKQKLTINFQLPWIRYYIFELSLLPLLENYLIQNNFNYVKLDYENIPNYVKNNFRNDRDVGVVDSEFNYEELITNYNEVNSFVKEFYEDCLEHQNTLKINFV